MRLGCFGIIFAIALLWGGGQGVYVGLTNKSITELTIDQVVKEKPKAKWLRVTDGRLDLLNCVYEESISGEPKDFYIPIMSRESESERIHVIYHTDEAEYSQTFKELQKVADDENADQAMILSKIVELSDKLFASKNIEGLVEFGIESDSGDGKARGMFENLAKDAIMIEAGGKPELMTSSLMFGGGFVVILVMVLLSAGRSKEA